MTSQEGNSPILTQESLKLPLTVVATVFLAIAGAAAGMTTVISTQDRHKERLDELSSKLTAPRWSALDQQRHEEIVEKKFLQLHEELENLRTSYNAYNANTTKQINELYDIQDEKILGNILLLRAKVRVLESRVGIYRPNVDLEEEFGSLEENHP